jgi:hypothetical protein
MALFAQPLGDIDAGRFVILDHQNFHLSPRPFLVAHRWATSDMP